MRANFYQVGGTHHISDYQHWDFVETVGLNYLEGCATRHVLSWRGKDGAIEGLKKALHYLNKLEESAGALGELRSARSTLLDPVEVWEEVRRFAQANNLNEPERRFLMILSTWRDVDELEGARQLLFSLMDEAELLS